MSAWGGWEDDPDAGANEGCSTCSSVSISPDFLRAFGVRVCRACKRDQPGYGLLSKAAAKERYLVTDSELAPLGSITKENPTNAQFNAMKLFLEAQVEEVSLRKHKGREGLEEEREARMRARVERGSREFKKRQRERAGGDGGKVMEERFRRKIEKDAAPHDHIYGEEVQDPEDEDTWSKKCAVCGHTVTFEKL